MKRRLWTAAAIVWLGVGLMLTTRGGLMLKRALLAEPEALFKAALAVILGVTVGLLKGKLVLGRAALKNKRRIEALPEPARFWQVFAPRFYLLIGLMMGLGRLLRMLAATSNNALFTVSGVYLGIGAALFISAFAYWYEEPFERKNPWLPEPGPIVAGRVGVLMANLGTPTAPTPRAVGQFLREFLSDRRVIEVNPIVWWFILNLFIVPLRKFSSAKLYQRLFTDSGSPLLTLGCCLAEKLQGRLGPEVVVRLGMRYGQPSMREAVAQLRAAGCDRILVVPAYPQYSGTTSASIYDEAYDAVRAYRFVPALRFLPPFPEHPEYIEALALRFEQFLEDKSYEHVVVSFHSIPCRYAELGDPYPGDCERTTAALVKRLGLAEGRWTMTYQSVFGNDPWLGPQTDATLEALAKKGVSKVAVICPGFLVDCLETIDEIAYEARHSFQEAGGEELHLVPCLNDHPRWVEALKVMVEHELQGWQAPREIQAVAPVEAVEVYA